MEPFDTGWEVHRDLKTGRTVERVVVRDDVVYWVRYPSLVPGKPFSCLKMSAGEFSRYLEDNSRMERFGPRRVLQLYDEEFGLQKELMDEDQVVDSGILTTDDLQTVKEGFAEGRQVAED